MWHQPGSGLIRISFRERLFGKALFGGNHGDYTHDTGRPSNNFKSLNPPDRARNVRDWW
jgi:hypothetical protein